MTDYWGGCSRSDGLGLWRCSFRHYPREDADSREKMPQLVRSISKSSCWQARHSLQRETLRTQQREGPSAPHEGPIVHYKESSEKYNAWYIEQPSFSENFLAVVMLAHDDTFIPYLPHACQEGMHGWWHPWYFTGLLVSTMNAFRECSASAFMNALMTRT